MNLFSYLSVIFIFFTSTSCQIYNLTVFALRHLDSFVEDESKTYSDCNEDQSDTGLLGLVQHVTIKYLRDCVNVVLYDRRFEDESNKLNFNLKDLLINYPGDYVNGQVFTHYKCFSS